MLYNTSIQLTYKTVSDELTNTIYRKELLKVLDLDSYDDTMIHTKIDTIYRTLVFDDTMKQNMRSNAAQLLSEDMVLGFTLCFSYDMFEETHAFICEQLKTQKHTLSQL